MKGGLAEGRNEQDRPVGAQLDFIALLGELRGAVACIYIYIYIADHPYRLTGRDEVNSTTAGRSNECHANNVSQDDEEAMRTGCS